MKTYFKHCLIILFAFWCNCANGQSEAVHKIVMTMPKIANSKLTVIDEKQKFTTHKWKNITDTATWVELFGLVNQKTAIGNAVRNVRVLGCWAVTEGQVAYIYCYEEKIKNAFKTIVRLTTINKNGKTKDIDPFELLAHPTGMRGKITVTKTFTINEYGVIHAKSTFASNKGKVLENQKTFTVDTSGDLAEPVSN